MTALGNGGMLWADQDNGLRHRRLTERWTLERTIGAADKPDVLVDRVTAVAFDPSGRFLATGGGTPSRSGELKVWDLATGSAVFEDTTTHSDSVVDVAFSPDGQFVASAATDRFMRVFRANDGTLVRPFEGHTGHVLGVAWNADGLILATAGADQVVKLWDFEQGRQRQTIEGFGKEVTSVCFVGAGETVLASCGDQSVRLGDERLSGADTFLHRAAASDDGAILVAGGQDSVLRIWRGSDKALMHRLEPGGN
jgi:WD40 repeat protein